jgi:hypothetical protein
MGCSFTAARFTFVGCSPFTTHSIASVCSVCPARSCSTAFSTHLARSYMQGFSLSVARSVVSGFLAFDGSLEGNGFALFLRLAPVQRLPRRCAARFDGTVCSVSPARSHFPCSSSMKARSRYRVFSLFGTRSKTMVSSSSAARSRSTGFFAVRNTILPQGFLRPTSARSP